MTKFDVVVIGSGPGGYVCAIRCSQLGFKTALVEKYKALGGTCLNVGCIPSKSLLDSSHHYYDAKNHFQAHGILIDGKIDIDFEKMISRKKNVIDQTTKGIDFLMKKNNIHVFYGHGSFLDNNTLHIRNDNESSEINFEKAVIATGSKPSTLPFAKIDKKRIITSTEALDLKEIPKKLLIIGAGVIGLELGQVYSRLGSEVKIIEYADKITPFMDSSVSKELIKIFKKQKISFFLSHEVKNIENNGKEVTVDAVDKNSENISFNGDYCLVSVGRKPYTEGLGLENIGLSTDKYGKINVNDQLQTNVENIYAIGDVIKGPMLAHKAEEEGILVAEIFSKQKPHIDYNLIPNVIYTWPEVASVGKTEQELNKNGIIYKKGQFPMRALGRSRASMDLDGFVKILADKKTDEILGVHIIGARAADLIAEAVTAMEFRASAEDVSRMSHSHPTYAEAIKEAALAATEDRALHI
tara:strand:+ start:2681 stop:4084 length:1404 start_codon:yes stop_codon:yes gene_type:complete